MWDLGVDLRECLSRRAVAWWPAAVGLEPAPEGRDQVVALTNRTLGVSSRGIFVYTLESWAEPIMLFA